jgi:hypothetical protein
MKSAGLVADDDRLQLVTKHDYMPLASLHTVVAIVEAILSPDAPAPPGVPT